MQRKLNLGKSTHESFKILGVISNCFGLLQVESISSKNVRNLRFTWKSFKILYWLVIVTATLTFIALTFISPHHNSFLYQKTTDVSLATMYLIMLLLYIDISKKWPRIMKKWSKLDAEMNCKYGYHPAYNMYFRIITSISLGTAALYCMMFVFCFTYKCSGHEIKLLECFFGNRFPYLFSYYNYSSLLGTFAMIVNLMSYFARVCNDTILMNLSAALSLRFTQIMRRVEKMIKQQKDNDWEKIRMDYLNLTELFYIVNESFSPAIFLAFTGNYLLILICLHNSLKIFTNDLQKFAFIVSFASVVTRSIALCLICGWVNDVSKKPTSLLTTFPSSESGNEIYRFLQQIRFDGIAFDGIGFFRVTRSMILKMGGAIVAYELILLQVDNVHILK